jgi:YfiH family protein
MQTGWLRTQVGFLHSPMLARLDWLDHRFGTRAAGDWGGAGAATLHQVHSATVVEADSAGRLGQGDALVTNRPQLWLAVRTADCYPVVLADPVHRAIAAVHAGWRGAAENIAARAVETLRERFGSDAGEVYAAIGPGIGPCCYQVGEEVAQRFDSGNRIRAGGAWRLDLLRVIRRQLSDAGLRGEHIDASGLCTFCLESEFCSFRREGEAAGRMVSGARIVGQRA